METPDLAGMRTDYPRDGLTEDEAGDDPIALFRRWIDDAAAADLPEPNAMALATATTDGRPSVRTVLLKGLDERGPVFYTHYDSRKGHEIDTNPRVAATMLWHPMHRQVRIEGRAHRVDPAESDAYFAGRPRASQLGACASEQSRAIEDRAALEERLAWVATAAGDDPVRRPDNWGGFRITVDSVEFWHGRSGRLHDRLLYVRTDEGWSRTRLQP
ncbi:pyridoxamine 5'-phosphate oxidase [Aeromicrobium marinum DSM 15272]|uniref:Pyridoxine/pyridoxamine 5'-phosphate oxidase n=1 Tax=Aeromicrobium marinum DSM 15272 TaxID=585531 RepID=E2SDH1_9ACTN|nr:pyridoxamine 5'-phosphate oxidase [Aeromicrobium marinum]EFQ82548.1 pyridoxamine 5'-phosphate oxidase [Aeromicrobium marinum DSM 15272]